MTIPAFAQGMRQEDADQFTQAPDRIVGWLINHP